MIESERLPGFTVESPDGVERRFPDGRACVLVVEDEASQMQRQRAHEIIGRHEVEVVAIADVGRYRRWPARSFALAAIRKTQAQEGVPVWLDWNDAVRSALSLPPGVTAFVVVSADGRVTFCAHGMLDPAEQQALERALRTLS